jgi:hypothetical protein
VWSLSGTIEGRTTGARLRCLTIGCPGWLIGVSWETGQRFRPCSQGWRFDPVAKTVRVTGGGEISARFTAGVRFTRQAIPLTSDCLGGHCSRGSGGVPRGTGAEPSPRCGSGFVGRRREDEPRQARPWPLFDLEDCPDNGQRGLAMSATVGNW